MSKNSIACFSLHNTNTDSFVNILDMLKKTGFFPEELSFQGKIIKANSFEDILKIIKKLDNHEISLIQINGRLGRLYVDVGLSRGMPNRRNIDIAVYLSTEKWIDTNVTHKNTFNNFLLKLRHAFSPKELTHDSTHRELDNQVNDEGFISK